MELFSREGTRGCKILWFCVWFHFSVASKMMLTDYIVNSGVQTSNDKNYSWNGKKGKEIYSEMV